jgi:hypothetical protein
MDLRSALRYPADPAAAFAMLADPAFLERKAVATGSLTHAGSVQPSPPGGATISLMRVLPAALPDFVRSFVGDTVEIHQTDVWNAPAADGSRTGTIEANISGAPVTIRGAMALEPDGSGTRHSITAVIKASVPLVGGKIEKTVIEIVHKAIEKEGEAGTAWLSGA